MPRSGLMPQACNVANLAANQREANTSTLWLRRPAPDCRGETRNARSESRAPEPSRGSLVPSLVLQQHTHCSCSVASNTARAIRPSLVQSDRPLRPPAPLFHLMSAVFGLDSTMIMPSDPPQEECSMPVSTLAGTPRDSGWRPYRSQREYL